MPLVRRKDIEGGRRDDDTFQEERMDEAAGGWGRKTEAAAKGVEGSGAIVDLALGRVVISGAIAELEL